MEGFFLYRLPDTSDFKGGTGPIHSGFSAGFIISSFDNSPQALLSIEKRGNFSFHDLIDFQNAFYQKEVTSYSPARLFPFPSETTSETTHSRNIHTIKDSLLNGEKTISCTVIKGDDRIDIAASLLSLSTSFPKAFVFCFFTPQSGLWIGASPELLLKKDGEELFTMALAGTRPVGLNEEWDSKNLDEQGMVVRYIEDVLNKYHLLFHHPDTPISKTAGPIEHLCTPFKIKGSGLSPDALSKFLSDFSPTPALCGLPKEKAYRLIKESENFSRGYYGGFIGPWQPLGDFSFFVLLRALRIEKEGWCMYAGGGITKYSEPEAEWMETRRKASSIIDRIAFIK